MTKRETILAAGKQISAIASGRAAEAVRAESPAEESPANANSKKEGEQDSQPHGAAAKPDASAK